MTEITMESRPCNVMAMFNCVPILRHGAKLGNFRMAENCVCLLGQSLLYVYYVPYCMHALNENFQTYQSLKTAPIYK